MQICPIIQHHVANLGVGVQMPTPQRNYCVFNENRVSEILAQADHALPVVDSFLKTANDERQILEGLYVIDKMVDKKVAGADKLYPTLSRFNNTNSAHIQTMLAGIYRKIKPVEAFGPLNKMLIKQSLYPTTNLYDPTEEIGGAILEYLKTSVAINNYNPYIYK
ncbi:MAG: hypothetical protein E7Z91_05160 [Cyanobacteria bacterium SIG30]|nr:hypothetical protein [Cyanobacteria bacterium SIG30]